MNTRPIQDLLMVYGRLSQLGAPYAPVCERMIELCADLTRVTTGDALHVLGTLVYEFPNHEFTLREIIGMTDVEGL